MKANYIGRKEELHPLEEDIRRIQFTGRATYIVSLPKKWVASMGLKAGSRVMISQRGHSLILTPVEMAKPLPQPVEVTVTISSQNDPDMIVREIISLYLLGYRIINVRAGDGHISAMQRNAIRELVRRKLVGTEIISESPGEIKLQTLISYPELSVESALRRVCLIAASMHDYATQALIGFDKRLAKEVIDLDDEVDRFSIYIIRQLKAAVQNERILHDIGLSQPRDCLGYRVIVKFVERVADHAAKIAENVLSLEERLSEEVLQKILDMSNFARNSFDEAVKSLFRKDYMLAESVVSRARGIIDIEKEAVKEILSKTKQIDAFSVRMIVESIRRIAEYASDIAEVVLNLNVNRMVAS
ncbi:MAG: AbrB/MazE/SpoVT family DNA-binding domain-containing protein [Candidatus Nezhaarchaeota archaeon]|nr:AbrB/MazE/SpoVT family DNA-binding domain-containing protein [Candidatus Nezhaarchaeota archaeon]